MSDKNPWITGDQAYRDFMQGGNYQGNAPQDKLAPERSPALPASPEVSWDKQKLTGIYTLAHGTQRPDWMTDDVLGLVDVAYTYQNTTGKDTLPSELAGLMDEIAKNYVPPPAPPAESGTGGKGLFGILPGTAGSKQELDLIASYGLEQEAWDALSWGEKLAMRLFKTNTTAGVATGAVAGLQGGPGGVVTGAVVGGTLASLSERYPWMEKVGNALDWGARNIFKRPLGMIQLGSAAVSGDYDIDVDKLGNTLEEAWDASEMFYRANSPLLQRILPGTKGYEEQDKIAEVWGGPGNPTQRWTLAPEEQGTQALVDYYNQLVEGKRPLPELEAEMIQKYGFEGDMTDLAGMIMLDPLNFAGGIAAKGLGVVGKVAGFSPEFMAGMKIGGSVNKGVKMFKSLSGMFHSVDDINAMGAVERWISGQNVETPKLLQVGNTGIRGAIERVPLVGKAFGYMAGLLPETRAKELISTLSQHIPGLWELAKNDPHQAFKVLEDIANNNALAATEYGMRSIGGQEMTALVPAIRNNLDNLRKLLDDYDSPARVEARTTLQKIAAQTGDDIGEILKNLSDPNKGDINARTYLKRMGDGAEGLDPGTVVQHALALDKQPLSDKGMLAAMGVKFVEDTGDWSAKYFGVEPVHGLNRLNNLVKSTQSLFLLDLSPTYFLQNTVDNAFKLLREGGLMTLMEWVPEQFLDEFYGEGMWPARVAEGLLHDTAQIEHMGAITKAAKPAKGALTPIEKGVSWVRQKAGLASKASGWMEGRQRMMGNAVMLKQAMAKLNRPGVGYGRIPDKLAARLGPELSQYIYNKVGGSRSFDAVEKKIFSDSPTFDANDAIPKVAEALGLEDNARVRTTLEKIGVMDWLDKNMPKDATPEQVHLKMGELLKEHQTKLNEWFHEQLNAQIEKMKLTADAEGVIGLMGHFERLVDVPVRQRILDFMEWEKVMALKNIISPETFNERVQLQYSFNRDTWKRVNGQTRATLLGAIDSMGGDVTFKDLFSKSLLSEEALWDDFFVSKQKTYKKFFDKWMKGKFEDDAASQLDWFKIREEFHAKYEDIYQKTILEQAKRDEALIRLMGDMYGEATGKATETWRTGLRDINSQLHKMMADFQKTLDDAPSGDHPRMYKEFLEQYNKLMRQKTVNNQQDARTAFTAADAAERDGSAPKQVTKFEPEVESDAANATTPEFEQRFGKSKVVDESGQPKPVFHGTTAKYDDFDKQYQTKGSGFFFAEDATQSKFYGDVSEYYLKMEKPLDLRNFSSLDKKTQKTVVDYFNEYDEWIDRYSGEPLDPISLIEEGMLYDYEGTGSGGRWNYLFRYAKNNGFDGVIVNDATDGVNALTYVVYESNQIIPSSLRTPKAPLVPEVLDGYAQGLGKKTPRFLGDGEAAPVGKAPPGYVEGASGFPHYDSLEDGMADYVMPMLTEMEKVLADPTRKKSSGLKGANLSPDEMREFNKWFYGQFKGEFSDLKLAATKYAEIGTDMAMLNYNRRYGFDNVANMVMPYQFWYGRTAVNWAINAIDKPAWIANWHRIREMQEKYATPVAGFPSRLTGKIRFEIPFLPDEFGDTVFFDPLHQVFGFEAMFQQVNKPLERDFSNKVSRAVFVIQEMINNEEIDAGEGKKALANQMGPIWDKAIAQAEAEIEAEIASPMDLVNAMTSFSLPIQWALTRQGVKDALKAYHLDDVLALTDRSRGGLGTLPSFATIQSLTSGVVPGGFNIPEFVAKTLGAVETNDRGFLWKYYVKRELGIMAGMGVDSDAAQLAMVEESGKLWDQAVDTVGKEQGARQLSSLVWLDFFPEGEQRQRKLQLEFSQAAEAGKTKEFLLEHPELEAWFMKSNWDDPDRMMFNFNKSALWDKYNGMSKLEQIQAKEQLDEVSNGKFTTDFLSTETRNYDSITTETVVQWNRLLNGVVPKNAPETPQVAALQYAKPEIVQGYEQYTQWRNQHPGYALSSVLYGLPEGMQSQFKLQHPEVVQYQQDKYVFMAQNPDLIPYLLGEDNELRNAEPEVALEVIRYRAEKAQMFYMIDLVQDQYYTLDKGIRKQFLNVHPELKAYWDWNRERSDMLSPSAYWYVKGEMGLEKLREGDDYKAPYMVDYSKFSTDLTVAMSRATLVGASLGSGAQEALMSIWKREGYPLGNYDAWLQFVMQAFSFTQ